MIDLELAVFEDRLCLYDGTSERFNLIICYNYENTLAGETHISLTNAITVIFEADTFATSSGGFHFEYEIVEVKVFECTANYFFIQSVEECLIPFLFQDCWR